MAAGECLRKRVYETLSDGRRRWKCWLKHEPDAETARWIKRKLRMTPREFWEFARCKRILTDEQMADPQRLLFEMD